jgi:hypothetical protein
MTKSFSPPLSADNNLIAVACCRDVDDLYRYLAQRLAAVAEIQTMTSAFARNASSNPHPSSHTDD